jgi:hypothetical protein
MAKGREFYRQLMDTHYIAMTGMCGGEGMSCKEASMRMQAISLRGYVENIGTEKLDEIFAENLYMAKAYPNEQSRKALWVFRMSDGKREFFDLSTKPITREEFTLGDASEPKPAGGFVITDVCLPVCPQECIDHGSVLYVVEQEHCLYCGNCFSICFTHVIEQK